MQSGGQRRSDLPVGSGLGLAVARADGGVEPVDVYVACGGPCAATGMAHLMHLMYKFSMHLFCLTCLHGMR